jgi:hypothetical protein
MFKKLRLNVLRKKVELIKDKGEIKSLIIKIIVQKKLNMVVTT